MRERDDFDLFALPPIVPPANPMPISDTSPTAMNRRYICQDCGEAALSGFGLCKRCAEYHE